MCFWVAQEPSKLPISGSSPRKISDEKLLTTLTQKGGDILTIVMSALFTFDNILCIHLHVLQITPSEPYDIVKH